MPKSAQVSGFDIAARNYKDLVNAVTNLGGGDDEMNRIHTDCDLRQRLAQMIVGQSVPTSGGTVTSELTVSVDHTRTVEEMMSAGGYNDYSRNITSQNFPHQREGIEAVTLKLIRFDRVMTTRELEQVLPSFGDPSDMDDMLALGAKFPDRQRQDLLVFLGASWVSPGGGRGVGCLRGGALFRRCGLALAGPRYRWYPCYVFAVRAR